MIKALLLIFLPGPTWEHVAATQRRWGAILSMHFLPLLLVTSVLEGYALVHWGRERGRIPHVEKFSVNQAVVYETAVVILFVLMAVVLSKMIKLLGETFHGRHTFRQVFTVAAYSMAPILLMRFFDMIPAASPWVTWIVGVTMAAATLYYGIPAIMRPDPPHALGLYMMTCLLLIFVTGLGRFVTAWYLQGKFTKLDALVSALARHLPF